MRHKREIAHHEREATNYKREATICKGEANEDSASENVTKEESGGVAEGGKKTNNWTKWWI